MRKVTKDQIPYALRQVEHGTPAVTLCRKMGISGQTFYASKKKYAGMGLTGLRRVKQAEDENRRLKGVVADLTLDKHMPQEVVLLSPPRSASAPSGWWARSG